MEFGGLSDGAKLLYARLCMYGGENGKCYPSQETLAKNLAKSPRQIIRLLKELETKGFIGWESPAEKKRVVGKTNHYFFLNHPVIVKAMKRREASNPGNPHVTPTSDIYGNFPGVVDVTQRDKKTRDKKEIKKIPVKGVFENRPYYQGDPP